MKKKIVSFVLLALVLLCAFNYRFFLRSFVEWQLHHYLLRMTDGDLQFESLIFSDNCIHLIEPRLILGNQTLASAEKATIDYSVDIFSRRIDADVKLLKLQLFANLQRSISMHYPLTKQSHHTLFQWNFSLEVEEGLFCLENAHVPITIAHQNNRTTMGLLLHHIDCAGISFLENYFPRLLVDRKMIQGNLDGFLSLSFQKGILVDMTGDLTVDGLLLGSSKTAQNPLGCLSGTLAFRQHKVVEFVFHGAVPQKNSSIPFEMRGSHHTNGWDASLLLCGNNDKASPILHFASRTGHYSFDIPCTTPATFPTVKRALHAFGLYFDEMELLEGELSGRCHVAYDPNQDNSLRMLSIDISADGACFRWNSLPEGWDTFSDVNGRLDLLGHELKCHWHGFDCTLVAGKEGIVKEPTHCLKCKVRGVLEEEPVTIETVIRTISHGLMIEGQAAIAEDEVAFAANVVLSNAPFTMEGGFQGHHIHPERFLKSFFPFLRQPENLLTGLIDIEGRFTDRNAAVTYSVNSLLFENEITHIEYGNSPQDGHHLLADKVLSGTHVFDFCQGTHKGVLAIEDVAYLDKRDGLLFTGIQSQLSIEGEKLSLGALQGFCSGIYFAGSLDVNLMPIERYPQKLSLALHTVQARTSQVKQLLAQLDPTCFLLQLPLDGELSLSKQGACLSITRLDDGQYEVAADLYGSIDEASMPLMSTAIDLNEINCNFAYHYPGHSLAIHDIQGTCCVHSSHATTEEYLFAGDYITFENLTNHPFTFDLWMGNKARDAIRLVGRAIPSASPNRFEVLLDPKVTHLGDIHPVISHFTVDNWSEIKSVKGSFNAQLNTIWHDFQSCARWITMPETLLKGLEAIHHASGELAIDFEYAKEGTTDRAHLQAAGQHIQFNDMIFDEFVLNGKKQGKEWSLEQFQLGAISLSADVIQEDDVWQIPFLGCRCGKALLIGMRGQFLPREYLFQGRMNLCEIHLAKLEEWPFFRSFASYAHPQGTLRATGELRVQCEKWLFDAHLNAATRSLELCGLPFDDDAHIPIHFVSNRGLTLRGLTATLNKQRTLSYPIPLRFSELNYFFDKEGLSLIGDCCLRDQWMPFRAKISHNCAGEVTLTEATDAEPHQLSMRWHNHPAGNLIIDKLQGELFGCYFDLQDKQDLRQEETDKEFYLQGEISGTASSLSQIMPPQMIPTQLLSWDLKGDYAMQGRWSFHPHEMIPYAFSGQLRGKECLWNGVAIDRLTAYLQCARHHIQAENIMLQHVNGEVAIERMVVINSQQGEPIFIIPHLKMRQIPLGSPHHFVIKEGEIFDCRGKLAAVRDFTSRGYVQFNQSIELPTTWVNKMDLQVDPHLLTPVSGTVHFEVHDQKFFFTKLEHVHSGNKLSRFALPKNHAPSYITFDGGLHLQLQIKPYHMLSKLADFFTLSIDGSFEEPSCKFQKNHTERDSKFDF